MICQLLQQLLQRQMLQQRNSNSHKLLPPCSVPAPPLLALMLLPLPPLPPPSDPALLHLAAHFFPPRPPLAHPLATPALPLLLPPPHPPPQNGPRLIYTH